MTFDFFSYLPDYISIFVLMFGLLGILLTHDIIDRDSLNNKFSLLYLSEFLVLYYSVCNVYTLFIVYLSNILNL